MVREKIRGNLIVISGPSGCGKGTICGELLKNNPDEEEFPRIKHTYCMAYSKSRRTNDYYIVALASDEKDYYFISKEEFEKRIKEDNFLEYATVHHGNYYGTPKDEVEKKLVKGIDVILEIDIQGALKVNNAMPEGIFIFIMPPSMRELKRRLIKRNTETKEQIIDRFKKAYQEINEVNKYNYIVINDDINRAVEKIEAIIKAEKCRVNRIEDFDLNTKEEMIHELLTEDLKDYNK